MHSPLSCPIGCWLLSLACNSSDVLKLCCRTISIFLSGFLSSLPCLICRCCLPLGDFHFSIPFLIFCLLSLLLFSSFPLLRLLIFPFSLIPHPLLPLCIVVLVFLATSCSVWGQLFLPKQCSPWVSELQLHVTASFCFVLMRYSFPKPCGKGLPLFVCFDTDTIMDLSQAFSLFSSFPFFSILFHTSLSWYCPL